MGQFPNPDTQFKKGQSGNPRGNHKRTKHISTWIQDLLNNENFEARYLGADLRMIEKKGAPVKAIIEVAIQKALAGDQRWADWLAKYGYGSKVDVTSNGETLTTALVQFIGDDNDSK